MTKDLVTRLRDETDGATVNPDGLEAADRIEALEKRGLVLEDYIRGLLIVIEDFEKVLEHFRERIRELEGTK